MTVSLRGGTAAAQAVGMLRATKDLPAVRQMLATANDVLGYDLLQARAPSDNASHMGGSSTPNPPTSPLPSQVCLGGPEEKLNDTAFSQPAIFVGNLAAVERLRSEEPAALASVSAAAGLSLGEYSALVFAGAMSFEDGLSVVKARAESMAAAASVRWVFLPLAPPATPAAAGLSPRLPAVAEAVMTCSRL